MCVCVRSTFVILPQPSEARRSNDANWEKMYALLRSYTSEHGTSFVPSTLNSDRYPGLGAWCSAQREAYRNTSKGPSAQPRLTKMQIRSLEVVGFEWVQTAWITKFELLKQWVREFRHCFEFPRPIMTKCIGRRLDVYDRHKNMVPPVYLGALK